MKEERINIIKKSKTASGPIVYWMSRDQRAMDNWALIFAQQLAIEKNQPLVVIFNLVDNFLEATQRQFSFMLKGLEKVQIKLSDFNIPFKILLGNPIDNVPKFINEISAGVLITDFDPLKIKKLWKKEVAKLIDIPIYEVDAHNIVPITYASNKAEFAAYTYRPKVNKLLPFFLETYDELKIQKNTLYLEIEKIDVQDLLSSININREVKEVEIFESGEDAAFKMLRNFIDNKLDKYNEYRNYPNYDYQSNLSPYLHFGQISSQRIALELQNYGENENAKAFLEELIVRKELADNYCYYNQNYDNHKGFHEWALSSLNEHINDKRDYLYSLEEFEQARTHEDLWNAAQLELTRTGKMHGYMRMYWAKKILEWSKDYAIAQQIAIYLNDKYSLDGRDPNGYTGIAWSIGGVHDRAWANHNVFGKIRYMNYNGAARKFDTNAYISKFIKKNFF